jgi:hypothetical protein
MVKHAWVAVRVADDAADAGAGEAVGNEFTRGSAQDLLAALSRLAARAPTLRPVPIGNPIRLVSRDESVDAG